MPAVTPGRLPRFLCVGLFFRQIAQDRFFLANISCANSALSKSVHLWPSRKAFLRHGPCGLEAVITTGSFDFASKSKAKKAFPPSPPQKKNKNQTNKRHVLVRVIVSNLGHSGRHNSVESFAHPLGRVVSTCIKMNQPYPALKITRYKQLSPSGSSSHLSQYRRAPPVDRCYQEGKISTDPGSKRIQSGPKSQRRYFVFQKGIGGPRWPKARTGTWSFLSEPISHTTSLNSIQ